MDFVRKGFCQEWILSGRDFVRKGFCQEGILSGRDFVRKEFCQEGILSGRDFVRKGFCQAGILILSEEAGSARKRALPGRRVSFGVVCVVFFWGERCEKLEAD